MDLDCWFTSSVKNCIHAGLMMVMRSVVLLLTQIFIFTADIPDAVKIIVVKSTIFCAQRDSVDMNIGECHSLGHVYFIIFP